MGIASGWQSCARLISLAVCTISCGSQISDVTRDGAASGGLSNPVTTGGRTATSSATGGTTPYSIGIGGASSSGDIGSAFTSLAIGGTSGALGGGAGFGGIGGTSESVVTGGTSAAFGGGGVGGVGGLLMTGGTITLGGSSSAGGAQPGGGTANAGSGTGSECTTNADCISKHLDQPYVCKSGACVMVTSPNCPVLIPAATALDLLKSSSPILVGGFVNMSSVANPHDTTAAVNWDLAFDEFNVATQGGLPSYQAGGLRRPFVGVLCQGYASSTIPKDIAASMAHLSDLGVTATLSTLPATDLYAAWTITSADQNMFFINTGSANLTLVNAPSGGMLWHLLGDPHTLAAPIVALLHQMEPYVYRQRLANFKATGIDNPDTEPLRVTLIYSTHPSMLDTHDVLTATDNKHPEAQLTFNGKSYVDNGSNYREVKVDSASVVGNVDLTAANTEILSHPPHVILGIATSEFVNLVALAEAAWNDVAPNQIRPYYLMSQFLFNSSSLLNVTSAYAEQTPPLNLRIAGVNYGSALDDHSRSLYSAYLARLVAANPSSTLTLSSTENYYDGAYYLLYSIAAAASHNAMPTAAEIRAGFVEHVISTTSGVTVDIGPASIATTVASLWGSTPYAMALWANGGYPRFDMLVGTRSNQTSAWCVAQDGAAVGQYQPDGLIYGNSLLSYAPNPGGVPSCLQNYCPIVADAGVAECPQDY